MIKQPYFQPNLQPNSVYKQNVSNLSVSYADSSLYQREPKLCFIDNFGLQRKFLLNNLQSTNPVGKRRRKLILIYHYRLRNNKFKG